MIFVKHTSPSYYEYLIECIVYNIHVYDNKHLKNIIYSMI